MMSRTSLALIACTLAFAGSAAAQTADKAASPAEAEVRAAVQHYILGHQTGDGSHMRQVFHPEVGRMVFFREGKMQTRSGEEYAAGFKGQPAADEAQRKRWIDMVDVTGNAAVAKVVLDYPNARITDYFQLIKSNGEWRIVNKIFQIDPKQK